MGSIRFIIGTAVALIGVSLHGTSAAEDRGGAGLPAGVLDGQLGQTGPVRQSIDGPDARIRRTDTGGDVWPAGMPDPPDLISISLGRWQPDDPLVSPYLGRYQLDGGYLRLDLVFLGLVNPPGPISVPFVPELYGPAPVFGFVEFDVDRNPNSGGEIIQPEFRYNGAVARFGGMPVGPEYVDRINLDGQVSDGDFQTVPWFDRSGEEFHLALLGGQAVNITDRNGNQDFLFDPGETWLVEGDFLHRAHGFEIFSFAGRYQPLVELRFDHSLISDTTRLTLVYPLTNAAFAASNDVPPEPNDIDDFNANSIAEALADLQLSAQIGIQQAHPYHPLIEPWAFEDVFQRLNAHTWRMTALLATVVDNPLGGGIIVYSDVWPNVRLGDFNGDGLAGNTDAAMVNDFIAMYDNDPVIDADGLNNGQVKLANFGPRFSIFDVDYDGDVDGFDAAFSLQMPGDFDNNGTIDLQDFAAFQRCDRIGLQGPSVLAWAGCLDAFDLNGDLDVTLADFALLAGMLTGP